MLTQHTHSSYTCALIATLLTVQARSLTSLDLSDNRIADEGAQALTHRYLMQAPTSGQKPHHHKH